MLRIVHICAEKGWRGGEQQLAWLIEESAVLGVKNFVVVREGTAFEEYCIKHNVEYMAMPLSSQFDFGSALKLKRYLKEVKADIVHAHSSKAHAIAVWAAVLGSKVPVVLSRKVVFPVSSNPLSSFKYNHSSIKRIICVSEKVKEVVARVAKNPNIFKVVYDGIDVQRFYKGEKRNILRKEFGIDNSEWLVGNVAMLTPDKDYFTFLKAAAIISKTIKARFVIIGEGEQKEELEKYAAQLNIADKVVFAGYRNDLPQILHELDLFMFTSRAEGLGSSLLDAMACSVPLVCTNAGGVVEIVKHGFNGLLANVGDADTLAANAIRLYNNPDVRQTIVTNALTFVQGFTKQKMAANTVAVYKEILSSNHE